MDGEVVIGTKLDTKSFEKQIKEVEYELEQIDYELSRAKELKLDSRTVDEYKAKAEKLNNKLIQLRKNQDELNNQGMKNITASIGNVGNSIEGIIKKTGKWILAIFSIRSAYSAIRSAVSTLSSYDDQMAINIEWIRYLLASTLKPLIETIINLAYKLLVYVGYIAKAWFGINIFANASKKAFDKAHSSAKKTNKELQKTLAGFDEMNILQKNNANSGSGGGGASTPNFPKMEDVPIPKWVKWIADNKDKVLDFFKILAGILAAIKIGQFLSDLGGVGEFVGKHAKAIGGILIAIYGIYMTFDGIIKFINDPSFDNFIEILEGIAIAVGGIAIAIGAWPVAIGAALALVVVLIVKYFDKIMDFFEGLIKWLDTNFLGALRKLFGPLGDMIYVPIKFAVEFGVRLFETFFGGIKKVVEGIVMIFKGDFFEGIKKIFGGLLDVFTAPLQGWWKAIKNTWEQIKKSVSYWVEEFSKQFSKIKDKMLDPINKFINAVKNLWSKIKGSIEDVGKKIADALNPAKLVEKAKSKISSAGQSIKNFFGFAKGGVVYHKLPKLAPGGIINQPGRGVPIASAIGGERGAEGVIPLTDAQQMALLGEAIGKYITINAQMNNYMNGRVISRELQKIQNESDFAFNR